MRRQAIEFAGEEANRLAADLWDGHGQPVLFLHGAGQTRRAWDMTARQVAERGMRAITLDMRGHGESDWVASANYEFSDFVGDAAAAIRAVTERFQAAPTVVGASLGGLSALAAEQRHAPLIDSLVLVDITPRMDAGGVDRIRGFMNERMEEGFGTLEEAAEAIARYLPGRSRPVSRDGLAKNLRLTPDGRYRWHWDPMLIASPRNIHERSLGFAAEIDAALSRVSIPVLLVRGVNSELIREDHVRDFLAKLPTARYVDVAGAGHMVASDRNDAFAAAILEFLADRRAA